MSELLPFDEWDFPTWVRARRRAMKWTQERAAKAAGIARPNYAAIESGARTISDEMRERIAATMAARPGSLLDFRRNDVVGIIEKYGYTNPRVFGSVARNTDRTDSDIDLLVDDTRTSLLAFRYFTMLCELENLLSVPVDVVVDEDHASRTLERARTEALPL